MVFFPFKQHKTLPDYMPNACDSANITFLSFLFLAVKKDMEETDSRMTQLKKKAKELRILDAKTAQNLCKFLVLLVVVSVIT